MKPRRIEPDLPLICGLFVAPLICAFNTAVGASLSGFKLDGLWIIALAGGFSASILTAPLGITTMWLLEFWNGGHHLKARLFALGCGLLGIAFCAWSATRIPIPVSLLAVIGGLLLPFLWLMGFFVFAFFARPPR
jgi:hypothetical protein